MFTTLNLTLASQTSTESGLLPGQNAAGNDQGLPVFDATTFAASLNLSLESDAGLASSDGSPLPLAGIELPVDAEAEAAAVLTGTVPEGVADDVWMLEDTADTTVPWPPGLEPAPEAIADAAPVPVANTTDDVLETADPPVIVPAAAPATPANVDAETPVLVATAATIAAREGTERRAPATDRASPTVFDGVETSDADLQARAVPERPAAETLRPAPVVQPESAPGQRFPEWVTPSSAASSSPDGNALSALANAAAASSSSQRGAASPTLPSLQTINTPVTDPGFGDSVADRVLMMASNKLGNAEIRLTPAELGPVRVQVSVDDGTASVQFHATQVATREALEQAMPRLRDMLAENGLSLGQASVSDDGSRQGVRDNAGDGARTGGTDAADGSVEIEAEAGSGEQSARVSNALVDTFA